MARNKGEALALSFGGTEFWGDIISVSMDNEEGSSDVTTFGDIAAGTNRQYYFTINAAQDAASGTFWSMVWDNTRTTVNFRYAPYGNTTATAEQPHFTGEAKIGPRPTISTETNTTSTFEVRFDIIGEPGLDRGTNAKALVTSIQSGKKAGDLAIIAGTRFTGATSVTWNGVATKFTVHSDGTITSVVGAQGPVVVTTAAGTSTAFAYVVTP